MTKLEDLRTRTFANALISILVLIFIFLAPLTYFRPFFAAGVALIASLALWEYYLLTKKKGCSPAASIGIITAILYLFALYFQTLFVGPLVDNLPSIVLGLSFFASFVFFALVGKDAILNLATTLFGILYIVVPLACFVRIAYYFPETYPKLEGSFWLLYLIATTKASDMGGYFIGRWFGKKRLAKRVSPNKTYAGAIGGLVCSIMISVVIAYLCHMAGYLKDLTLAWALVLGVILGIFGLLGDLAESLLKRDAETKDSNVIPGIGGILDMVDSLLFTTPIIYIFLKVIII